MAKKSLQGLQVALGIIGTIAAVVIVFAYGVSSDIYSDEHPDLSQQGSAQFSSTLSGQDVSEAIDSTTALPASSESEGPSDSVVPPDPTTQNVADAKQPAIKPDSSDPSAATSASDVGKLTDQVETQVISDVTTQGNGYASLQEVDSENKDNENNPEVDRQVQITAKIESIMTTIQSDNRNDGKDSADYEGEEKKDKHDHHKSGKEDGDGHKHKDKEKGKGHHKD
jgi:hypothetical protein